MPHYLGETPVFDFLSRSLSSQNRHGLHEPFRHLRRGLAVTAPNAAEQDGRDAGNSRQFAHGAGSDQEYVTYDSAEVAIRKCGSSMQPNVRGYLTGLVLPRGIVLHSIIRPCTATSRETCGASWKRRPASRRNRSAVGTGLRRAFANELRAAPLRDLVALGGWKEPQTVVKTYQQASLDTMRDALMALRNPALPVLKGGADQGAQPCATKPENEACCGHDGAWRSAFVAALERLPTVIRAASLEGRLPDGTSERARSGDGRSAA